MPYSYFAYIITNHNNSVLYTGVTNDITRRVFEHKNGLVKNSFSKKYKLYKLVWVDEFENVDEAIATEKMIKGWKREKKIKMIKKMNPEFENLLPC